MSAENIPVSVIIVNFNTKDFTRAAIVALLKSAPAPAEVIVVDNNSTDGSAEMISRNFPTVRLIKNDANVGFARGNNRAIEIATQPFIWLLNSDTKTPPGALFQLYEYMSENEKVGAVGPQLIYPDGAWQSVGGYFPSVSNVFLYLFPLLIFTPKIFRKKIHSIAFYPKKITEPISLDYCTGAAIFLRRCALEQAGLLGEDYFMYFEETDLCWRLKKLGWDVKAIPTDPVVHIYGGSFKTKHDPKRLQLFLESLKIFVNKYYVGWKKFFILSEVNLLGKLSVAIKRLKNAL